MAVNAATRRDTRNIILLTILLSITESFVTVKMNVDGRRPIGFGGVLDLGDRTRTSCQYKIYVQLYNPEDPIVAW
jgi:hypothetical protein